MKQRMQSLLAILFSLALLASACGGSDGVVDAVTDAAGDAVDAAGDAVDDAAEAVDDAMDDEDDAMDDEEDAPVENEEVVEAGTEAEGDVDTAVEAVSEPRQQGGELIVGLEAEAVGMRPWEDSCASACYNMFVNVYDKLMEQRSDGTYGGFLLEDITANEDFTTWTGTLREGISFHNGVALTAQSIEDSWPIWQAGSQSASQIAASNLANIEATGDLEVTWTLSQPNSAFPAFLSRAQLGMIFEPGAAADADAFNEAPIGTGPFVFTSRDLDNETVFDRNSDYWMSDQNGTQLPYLDRIVFRPIPDEGTRLDAVLSGTTGVAHTLRQGTIRDGRDAREGGADITMFEFQGNNVGGGQFNVLIPPFDDVRVRRGLVHLNPQDQVIEALGGTGISLPGTQWYSPDSPWYSEKVAAAWPQFDFEQGVALLTEYVNDPARSDGKAVGEPIEAELSCPPDPTLIAAMQVIEQIWSSTGLVDTNLTNYDQQTHINYALGADNGFVGSHTTHCWRWSDDNDPSVGINPFLAPPTAEIAEAAGIPGVVSPLNFSNYFDGEAFGAAVAATQTDNFEERYALYESIQLKLAEDVPIWYSGHTATAFITDSAVSGVTAWELPDGSLGAGMPNAEGRWPQVWLEN